MAPNPTHPLKASPLGHAAQLAIRYQAQPAQTETSTRHVPTKSESG